MGVTRGQISEVTHNALNQIQPISFWRDLLEKLNVCDVFSYCVMIVNHITRVVFGIL